MAVALVATTWIAAAAVAWRAGAGRLAGRMLAVGLAGVALAVGQAGAQTSDGAAALRAVALAAVLALALHLAVSLPSGAVGAARRRALVAGGYLAALPFAVLALRVRPELPTGPLVATAVALLAAAAGAFVAACRRADRSARSRLQWHGWGVLVLLGLGTATWAAAVLTGWPARPALATALATATIPLGLALSTVPAARHRAGVVLVHTIVVVGLVALVAGCYLVIVVGLDGRPDGSGRTLVALSLLAAAVASAASVPARHRLVAFANQRVYGDRVAPDTTLRTFATRMTRSVPMDELLLQLVESLRRSLDLTCAEVWTGADGTYERQVSMPTRARVPVVLGEDELGVASRTRVVGNGWLAVWAPGLLDGREDSRVRVAPIAHLGELLGFLVAERPEASSPFTDEEDGVLADLSRQLGLALHNVRLDSALQASLDELQVRNAELQASRARIVVASDEARRRIERNLHDGAQQHLVAMAVKVGLARKLLASDPVLADGLLEELRADVQTTVGELRELAHGIYPPLLRDRGLAEALQAAANRSPLPATVVVEGVGRVDDELEAAVYFCCLEAMQNAGKHAGEDATIEVEVCREAERVTFAVRDDGAGFDLAAVSGGHGFANMEDRLGAIGGHVAVRSTPGGGTTVSGEVPLAGHDRVS
ncbi:MAG: sensor histidine kinase [Actinobacteria bacterium]|nr:sensor histidine kinase [Actinomycetota bacterium]